MQKNKQTNVIRFDFTKLMKIGVDDFNVRQDGNLVYLEYNNALGGPILTEEAHKTLDQLPEETREAIYDRVCRLFERSVILAALSE